MLKSVHLRNVGPSSEMGLELSPRLNLITGDNGLGKSFLLDVSWWALTRRWPQELNRDLTSGYAARPTKIKDPAEISFELDSKVKSVSYKSTYSPKDEAWLGRAGRPWNPGLVIYALADGGFSVWDPSRNYWTKKGNVDIQERLPAFVLSQGDVWNGRREMSGTHNTQIINGLIADWASWIRESGADAQRMEKVLKALTPDDDPNSMTPCRDFARLSVEDARDIPKINMGYGQEVPILFASLGVRRIVALSYMLAWSWREHIRASEHIGSTPSNRIILLFDEIEAHLHPRWQRKVVPALLNVAKSLTADEGASIQIIAATHSPLVMASMESVFDKDKDAWFDLDLEQGQVHLRKRQFVRRGDVASWLQSEAFDLQEARSEQAEIALGRAKNLALEPSPSHHEIVAVERLLLGALSDTDRFWVRWEQFKENVQKTRDKRDA
ncbi:AAA family ATPase [Rhodobacter sp. NSM]|uniref:AAA family ATPase n=1 Tax=Rhodobacter sp. NSM TaxID=3457501 RepID=UPI003FCF7E78